MTETIVISSDDQARYNDPYTEQAFLHFVQDYQPDVFVKNGDLADLTALGKYPTAMIDRLTLMPDIAASRSILANARDAAPNARRVVTEGNHEERLRRYLVTHAPELEEVPGLDVATLIGAEEYGFEYVGPYGAGIDWHGIYIYHGLSHAQSAALNELRSRWTSGVSGHTQRLKAWYFTDGMGEPHAWFEDGCMCYVEPDKAPPSFRRYAQNDWQQGFVVGEWHESGVWSLTPVHIFNHRFVWDGNLYTPNGVE